MQYLKGLGMLKEISINNVKATRVHCACSFYTLVVECGPWFVVKLSHFSLISFVKELEEGEVGGWKLMCTNGLEDMIRHGCSSRPLCKDQVVLIGGVTPSFSFQI